MNSWKYRETPRGQNKHVVFDDSPGQRALCGLLPRQGWVDDRRPRRTTRLARVFPCTSCTHKLVKLSNRGR